MDTIILSLDEDNFIELPLPDLDNSDAYEPVVNIYRSRNNTPYTVLEAKARCEDSSYTFSNLSPEKTAEFKSFLLMSSGYELTLTDHNGDEFVVIIINPDAEFKNLGRGEYTSVSLSLRKIA